MEVFRTYNGRDNYETWEEDFEFNLMRRGLDGGKAAQQAQCLGLFIFYGGSRVKEVYTIHKEDEKEDRHNNYHITITQK